MQEKNKDSNNVREWLLKLIECFRKEYDKLNDTEKLQVSNTSDYRQPCQIEVFWLDEPIEYQIIVLTHDNERKDKEIIINGPYKGYEFLDNIEKIMQESRWIKAIPKDSPYRGAESGTVKYSDIFTNILYNCLNTIKNSVFLKIKSGYESGMMLASKGWCWYVVGNISELDYSKIINESINEAKTRDRAIREKPQEKQPNIQQAPQLKGYGTFFYPPIWVGKIPEKTFRQKISGDYSRFPSKVFDSIFNGKKIIVNCDGFLGVETENKEHAIRVLNTIFGTAFIFGNNCFTVRESEIAEIDIEPNTLTIFSTTMRMSSLRTLLMDWFRPTIIQRERNEVSEDKIKEIITKAEKISQNEDLTEQLIFLLDGYTHYNNSEYSQSFIINWLVIEKFLFKLWENLLKYKQITGKRKDKLTNTILWGTDYILESLNINGKIDNDTYNSLIELKSKRNNFVHKAKLIDKPTSEKLLNITLNIVKNNLQSVGVR
jgi:hypothetical protein